MRIMQIEFAMESQQSVQQAHACEVVAGDEKPDFAGLDWLDPVWSTKCNFITHHIPPDTFNDMFVYAHTYKYIRTYLHISLLLWPDLAGSCRQPCFSYCYAETAPPNDFRLFQAETLPFGKSMRFSSDSMWSFKWIDFRQDPDPPVRILAHILHGLRYKIGWCVQVHILWPETDFNRDFTTFHQMTPPGQGHRILGIPPSESLIHKLGSPIQTLASQIQMSSWAPTCTVWLCSGFSLLVVLNLHYCYLPF